jgi:hypothetical protein
MVGCIVFKPAYERKAPFLVQLPKPFRPLLKKIVLYFIFRCPLFDPIEKANVS